jgi:hypothetical protein
MSKPESVADAREKLTALHEYREAFFGIQQVARRNSKVPKSERLRSEAHLAVLATWAEDINEEILSVLDYLVEESKLEA